MIDVYNRLVKTFSNAQPRLSILFRTSPCRTPTPRLQPRSLPRGSGVHTNMHAAATLRDLHALMALLVQLFFNLLEGAPFGLRNELS